MTGDPSRRPSNERVRVAAVDFRVERECPSCFGDGWHWPDRGRPMRKVTCETCGGDGQRTVAMLEMK